MKLKKIILLFLGIVVEFFAHDFFSKQSLIIENYGISLSINWVSSLFLNIIFILIIGWFCWREKSYFLSLVLIGGLINIVDRLVFGYVRDYWNVGGILVNNLNDWLIGTGVLLFLLEMIWKKQK